MRETAAAQGSGTSGTFFQYRRPIKISLDVDKGDLVPEVPETRLLTSQKHRYFRHL
jgi:hypothetical protein